jgi:hypothetical protein
MTVIRTLAIATLLASALVAQTPPAAPAPQAKPAEPDLATLRAMRSKLFVIQFRDPLQLQRVLSALGSGANGATMRFNNEGGLNTIGVRDFPENLVLIEEAIKRLDVPQAAPQASDVELHIQVLFASKQPTTEGSLPDELREVVKSLKGSLAYRSYTLAASFIQRWDPSGDRYVEGKGRIDGSALALGTAKEPSQLRLEWVAYPSTNPEQRLKTLGFLHIPRFQFSATEEYHFTTEKVSSSGTRHVAQLETSLNLKEGEHVVVGTSMVKDHGLIVVLSAKRVN